MITTRPLGTGFRADRAEPSGPGLGAVLMACVGLLLGACSSTGGDAAAPDGPVATEQDPAASTGADPAGSGDAPSGAGTVTVADGLVNLDVPGGWTVASRYEGAIPTISFRDDAREWTLSDDPFLEVAHLEHTDLGIGLAVGLERRFNTAQEARWRQALVGYLEDELGLSVDREVATDWYGGHQVHGVLASGDHLRLDLAAIGSQFVTVASTITGEPTAEVAAAIDQIRDSLEVDETVLPVLQHALDASVFAEQPGHGRFEASILTPWTWDRMDQQDDWVSWEDTTGDGWMYQVVEAHDETLGFDGMIESHTDPDSGRMGYFFDREPVPATASANGLDLTIWWEGDPSEATAAAVFAEDGSYFFAAYIYIDDNDVLHEIVESTWFIEHNRT